jgi:F0F1-type ATP synthase membrane subunit b/b'
MKILRSILRPLVKIFLPSLVEEAKYEIRKVIVKELDYVTRNLYLLEKDFRGKISTITKENIEELRKEIVDLHKEFTDKILTGIEDATNKGERRVSQLIDRVEEYGISKEVLNKLTK